MCATMLVYQTPFVFQKTGLQIAVTYANVYILIVSLFYIPYLILLCFKIGFPVKIFAKDLCEVVW